jgi:serine/threonine-protein kinase
MSNTRREEIESLFEAALDLPPQERPRFVQGVCAGDVGLEREVLALLRAHEVAEGVLEADAAGAAAELFEGRTRLRRVGAYRIVEELGRGGMGVVYSGERDDGQFRRRVAIKVMRSALGGPDSKELSRRFKVERQILATLDHPNIGRLLDGGLTEDGRPYLVMEHVEGVPIDVYCDRKRLRIEDRLRLFCEVAHAVHYAHRNLVVHRDLKPSNIFVTADGVVKLLDFGIAKILDPSSVGETASLTGSGMRLMTPEYASPEQVRGEPITTATDVYGLGVVLYELLTGRRPFELSSKSPVDWQRVILEVEPVRPSSLVGRLQADRRPPAEGEPARESGEDRPLIVPADEHAWGLPLLDARDYAWKTRRARLRRRLRGDLDRIVLMALRKEPARRYASAEGLAEDIERHLQGLPVIAQQDNRRYRIRKFVSRHRAETAAAALVGLSLITGAGVAFWQASVARHERDRAEVARLEAEQALGRSEQVTGFLIGLFEAANPDQALADTVAARELLRRGMARAEELSGQPGVQARIFDAVGQVYERLGQYDRAQELFERAVALRLGERHELTQPDVAVSLNNLAWVLRRKGEYTRAEALHLEALAIQERLLGPEHPDVAETLMDLGFLYPYLARLDDSEAAYRRALAIRRATLGDDDPRVAETLVMLASVRRRQGYWDEAERFFREALELQKRIYGTEHEEVAATMIHLGDIYQEHKRRYAEAEAIFREALGIQTRKLGDEHPKLIHGLNSLASVLSAQGDHVAAESLFRRSLTIHRDIFGPDYPGVAGSLSDVARELTAQGRYAEAEALERESYATWKRAMGPDHPVISGAMVELADVLIPQGKLAEAEELYRDALARRRLQYPGHPLTAETAAGLAALLVKKSEFIEAESLLGEAMKIMRALYPEGHDLVRAVHRGLGDLYAAWGKSEEAKRHFALGDAP